MDVSALRGLGERPRRRGFFVTLILFGLVPIALCGLSGFGLTSMELSAAERVCVGVPAGMPRHEVEALLAHELDARLNGYGGPTGGPVSAIELGQRGELVSWSCQVLLDAEGNATRSHVHSWVVPVLPARSRLPTLPLPGMGELPLPILPTSAPSTIPAADDPNHELPPEVRAAISPGASP